MWWRSARDIGTKTEDTVRVQAPDIGGSQVRSTEGDAGDMLQPRSRGSAQGAQPASARSRTPLPHASTCDAFASSTTVCSVLPSNRISLLLIRLVTHTPPFLIEGKPVRPASMTECQDDLRRLQLSVMGNRESGQTPAERLDDVQPFAARIRTAFVRVVQPVGHDAGAALVDEHHEPVGDVGTPGELSGPAPRADGDPRSARLSAVTKFAGGRGTPSTSTSHGVSAPCWSSRHISTCVPEIRQQERAVGIQRDAVGSKLDTGILREPCLLAAVGPDDRDASAPVGDEHIARGRTKDAFRTMEALREGLEGRRQGDGG